MSAGSVGSTSIGINWLLGIVFVTLKLCGVIDWSWWWVTLPFWAGAALLVIIGLVIVFALAMRRAWDWRMR